MGHMEHTDHIFNTFLEYTIEELEHRVVSNVLSNLINNGYQLTDEHTVQLLRAYESILLIRIKYWTQFGDQISDYITLALSEICNAFTIACDILIASAATSLKAMVYCRLLRAEFDRHLLKVWPNETHTAFKSYETAFNESKKLPSNDILRLGVGFRFAVFCFKVYCRPLLAIKYANQILDSYEKGNQFLDNEAETYCIESIRRLIDDCLGKTSCLK